MAENSLMARLDCLVGKYEEIELLITDPAVIADMRRFVKLNKEYKELGALMEARARYMQLIRQLDEAKELFATESDADMREMAREEIDQCETQLPALDEELKNGMEVIVYRVEFKERTEEEAIPYETEYTYSDALYRNRTRTLEGGKEGTKAVVYEDRYVNGELVKSTAISEKFIKDSVKEVVQVGTRVSSFPSSLPVGTPISEMSEPS